VFRVTIYGTFRIPVCVLPFVCLFLALCLSVSLSVAYMSASLRVCSFSDNFVTPALRGRHLRHNIAAANFAAGKDEFTAETNGVDCRATDAVVRHLLWLKLHLLRFVVDL